MSRAKAILWCVSFRKHIQVIKKFIQYVNVELITFTPICVCKFYVIKFTITLAFSAMKSIKHPKLDGLW